MAVGQSANYPPAYKNTRAILSAIEVTLANRFSQEIRETASLSTPRMSGLRFYPRQEVKKRIVDGQYPEVSAWRYESAQCGCTFRVYPEGVNQAQISKRVNGMAVMLYVLGLSYGAVEIVLYSLGIGIGKSSVYRAVQSVAEKVPGMKKEKLLDGYRTKAVGADITSIRCNGQWIPIGIVVDATNGIVLSIDELPGEDAEQLKAWLEPILDAVEADAFKKVSDETGRSQQVCKSHVGRNTDALVDELSAIVRTGQDYSLNVIGITPEQALAELAALKTMIHTRLPEDQSKLEEIYLRYANASKPGKGKKHDLA